MLQYVKQADVRWMTTSVKIRKNEKESKQGEII